MCRYGFPQAATVNASCEADPRADPCFRHDRRCLLNRPGKLEKNRGTLLHSEEGEEGATIALPRLGFLWAAEPSLNVTMYGCRNVPRAERGRRFRRHVCPLFPFPSPSCSGNFEEPLMKSRVIAAVLSVGMFCIASQASAFELFNMLGGGYGYGGGCGCEAACGCDTGCGHDHGCGCDRGCHKQRCCKSRCHKSRCCHNTCGCDMAAPTCAAPVSCAAPVAPSCGYEPSCGAAPSCGCDKACGRCGCKKQRCHRQRCCKSRCHKSRCCENTCGCDVAPVCGCGA
jgi:hypothetical protein